MGCVLTLPGLPAAALQPELRRRGVRARTRGPVTGLADDPAAAAIRGLSGQVSRRPPVVPGSDLGRLCAPVSGGRRDRTAGVLPLRAGRIRWQSGLRCDLSPLWRVVPATRDRRLVVRFLFRDAAQRIADPGHAEAPQYQLLHALSAILGGGERECADGNLVSVRPG